jgi:hypothetical protein
MFKSESEFLQYAMHHYDNPQCSTVSEFEEDLKKFLYLKKLFTRYKKNDELKEKMHTLAIALTEKDRLIHSFQFQQR